MEYAEPEFWYCVRLRIQPGMNVREFRDDGVQVV